MVAKAACANSVALSSSTDVESRRDGLGFPEQLQRDAKIRTDEGESLAFLEGLQKIANLEVAPPSPRSPQEEFNGRDESTAPLKSTWEEGGSAESISSDEMGYDPAPLSVVTIPLSRLKSDDETTERTIETIRLQLEDLDVLTESSLPAAPSKSTEVVEHLRRILESLLAMKKQQVQQKDESLSRRRNKTPSKRRSSDQQMTSVDPPSTSGPKEEIDLEDLELFQLVLERSMTEQHVNNGDPSDSSGQAPMGPPEGDDNKDDRKPHALDAFEMEKKQEKKQQQHQQQPQHQEPQARFFGNCSPNNDPSREPERSDWWRTMGPAMRSQSEPIIGKLDPAGSLLRNDLSRMPYIVERWRRASSESPIRGASSGTFKKIDPDGALLRNDLAEKPFYIIEKLAVAPPTGFEWRCSTERLTRGSSEPIARPCSGETGEARKMSHMMERQHPTPRVPSDWQRVAGASLRSVSELPKKLDPDGLKRDSDLRKEDLGGGRATTELREEQATGYPAKAQIRRPSDPPIESRLVAEQMQGKNECHLPEPVENPDRYGTTFTSEPSVMPVASNPCFEGSVWRGAPLADRCSHVGVQEGRRFSDPPAVSSAQFAAATRNVRISSRDPNGAMASARISSRDPDGAIASAAVARSQSAEPSTNARSCQYGSQNSRSCSGSEGVLTRNGWTNSQEQAHGLAEEDAGHNTPHQWWRQAERVFRPSIGPLFEDEGVRVSSLERQHQLFQCHIQEQWRAAVAATGTAAAASSVAGIRDVRHRHEDSGKKQDCRHCRRSSCPGAIHVAGISPSDGVASVVSCCGDACSPEPRSEARPKSAPLTDADTTTLCSGGPGGIERECAARFGHPPPMVSAGWREEDSEEDNGGGSLIDDVLLSTPSADVRSSTVRGCDAEPVETLGGLHKWGGRSGAICVEGALLPSEDDQEADAGEDERESAQHAVVLRGPPAEAGSQRIPHTGNTEDAESAQSGAILERQRVPPPNTASLLSRDGDVEDADGDRDGTQPLTDPLNGMPTTVIAVPAPPPLECEVERGPGLVSAYTVNDDDEQRRDAALQELNLAVASLQRRQREMAGEAEPVRATVVRVEDSIEVTCSRRAHHLWHRISRWMKKRRHRTSCRGHHVDDPV